MAKVENIQLWYTPTPKQLSLHMAYARQILYGGAAGGAKSTGLRWDGYEMCWNNPGCDAYLFRCSRMELEQTHIKKVAQELPAVMGSYNRTRNRFEFVNGSFLNMCYLEHPGDAEKYNSCEIHWLGFDEASHAEPYDLAYLQSRLRIGSWRPTEAYKHFFPRCIFASNPGGPSHNWLKEKFITSGPWETITYDKTKASKGDPKGWTTLYIPSRMTDNPHLDENYEGAFGDLPEWKKRRLVEGDWDIVEGAYFDCWNPQVHVIQPFKVPAYWTKFMALDWGHATPFSVHWFAVSDGSPLEDGRSYPDGALIVYREWYGGTLGKNKGLRLAGDEVAAEILNKEEGEKISFRVGDPSAWASDGGPSPAEQLARGKVYMSKADNEREAGSQQLYSRLKGGKDCCPMLYLFSNCRAGMAQLASIMADEKHPEQYDKGGEDHAVDSLRYGAMARPWVTKKDQPKKGMCELPTFEELTKMAWTKQRQDSRARTIRL